MIINWEKECQFKRFEDVKNGDVFEFKGDYFIKVSTDESDYNGVNLSDGKKSYFSAGDEVELIDCELVLK